MTKKKNFVSRATAFLAAMVFSMTLLMVFPSETFIATADNSSSESVTVTAQEAGMNITGVIELNGVPLTSGSEVSNGDVISLDVNWTLPNNFEYVNGTFTYDLTGKLYGISLADVIIPVGNTAIYQVKNNVLYIKLLTGHSNRYGSCSLSGSINVSENEVGDNGAFTLQFIGTPNIDTNTSSVPVIVTDYVPGLVVNKTTSGGVTYENGQYYQQFNILVHSNNQASTNVSISDVADAGFDFSQATDFTVKYNGYGKPDVDYTLTNTANGFDITFNEPVGTAWEDYINISYKVPVDVHGVINGTETKVNTITATADEQQPLTDTAESSITAPAISKNGAYDSATGKIKWTITIYPGTIAAESPDFVITEIPGSNLDEDELKAIFGEDLQISSDDPNLTYADGKYTYTYETTASANPVEDTTYSNSAKVEFDNLTKPYTTNEIPVNVPKSVSDFVTKTYGNFNDDGTLPWTITVSLPNLDVTQIKVYDYTNNNNVVMDADMFTISGVNGTGGTLTPAYGTASSTDIGYVNWNGSQIEFYITDTDFLTENKGQDITINYDMTLPDGTTSITNTVSVDLKITGAPNPINDSVYTEFAPDFIASKYTTTDVSQFPQAANYHFPVLWGIRIDGDENFKAGDKIVVEDTIPDGLTLVNDAVIVGVENDNGYGTYNFKDQLTTTVSGSTVKFELNVTQLMIDEANKYNTDPNYQNIMPIRIIYLTHADDDITEIYQDGTKTYENTASVKVNNAPVGNVTAEKTITPATGDVVTKTAVEIKPGAEDPDDANAYADYTITINPDAVKLTDGTSITAQDTLGSRLTLVGTPVISPSEGTSSSYNNGVLSFTLKDETAYTITYRVVVETIGKDDVVPEDKLTDMFGNTIIVDVAGVTDFSANSPYTEIYYRSEADYSSDEEESEITITGTKSWTDDAKDGDARPSKIIIQLTAHKTDSNGNALPDEILPLYEFDAPAENQPWTYTISNLPTLISATGTKIKYDITEVKADGYDIVTYTGSNTNITKVGDTTEYTVNITNTFTAATTEVGSLTVHKSWVGDTAADRPEIQITVVDVSGNGAYSQTKTLTDTSVTFENLPLYTYSRDNDNNLVRTLRQYAITESVVDAAEQSKLDNYNLTKSYTGDYFTLTETIAKDFKLTSAVEQTLTNTLKDPEKTSVSVKKVWNDDDDRDGLRPDSVTIKLLADGAEADSVTLNEDNGWAHTFTDLDKTNAGGNTIAYTISEVSVAGYTSATVGNSADGFTVTNSHTPEVTEVTVTKEWDDADNQDGKRPASISVTLLANGTAYSTYTLTENDNWTYTVSNIPKNADGEAIKYTWSEEDIEDYELTSNVTNGADTTLTNKYTPELTSATVKKVWDDAENQDGIRPASLKVTLSNGTEVTLNDQNGWTATVNNLPVYANGQKIDYSWTEENVADYTLTTSVESTTTTLTNTHIPETVSISGIKKWDDASDQDGIRPDSIVIELLKNGSKIDEHTVSGSGNEWSWSITDLPKYDAGNEISYTVREVVPSGYSASYSADTTVITNTHTPEVTTVTVTKEWMDANNQDGIRPDEITVNLLANGQPVDLKVISEADGWTHTFTDLPKFSSGVEIVYSVTENDVTGYTSAVEGFEITNTHTPETVSVNGNKTWDDDSNRDGKRPASITVNLLADGQKTASKNITEADGWAYSFDNLPKYKNGTEIVYTITENEVAGYTTSITGYNITNTHESEKISLSGAKTWDDAGNESQRPDSITVNLLANGKSVDSKIVTAADDWKYTFTDLYKYEYGTEINYSIVENTIDDYTPTYTGYNISNKYTPGKTFVNVSKVWVDANNQDGIRPDSVTVNLLADGEIIATHILSASNNWTYFIDLDIYKADGTTPINYTVEEVNVPQDYTSAVSGNTATGFVVTNTHTPDTTEATVKKVWNDAENQDGIRPDSITVQLRANGIPYGTSVTLNEANGWTSTIKNLPLNSNGQEVEYTWTENALPEGYTLESSITNGTVTTLTNSHTPETVDVSGTKSWADNDNSEGKRPASITVRLLANGNEVGFKTVTEADGWAYEFADMPKYENGNLISYTITEDAVTDYTTVINGYNITNIIVTAAPAETVDISVTKTWNDNSNAAAVRPSTLEITLKRNGTAIKTMSADWVKNGNEWTYTFTDLPKYPDGSTTEYVYTVEEENLSSIGYTSSSASTQYNFSFVNTYTNNSGGSTPSIPDNPKPPAPPVTPYPPYVTPEKPFIPKEPEDVSSGSGAEAEADTIGTVDTTSYAFIAILLAVTAGGILIARRRQK